MSDDLMKHPLQWLKALSRRVTGEVHVLAAFGVAALGLLGFGALAEDLVEGDSHGFDASILLAMREPGDLSNPVGPPWFEAAVADLTALGGYAILTLVVVFAALYLGAKGRWKHAGFLVAAVISGAAMSQVLKLGFDRPRPDIVEHLTHAMNSSFPSGHATLSAVTYLTLGLLVADAHEEARVRTVIMGGAVMIAVIVGVSRVYLGVHWPSDVLAGWFLGAAWAALFWAALKIVAPDARIHKRT